MNGDPAMDGNQIGLRVGERLALVRAERGLTLAEVAAATRIPIRHLKTIESGKYDGLPASTYSAGFVKSYARLLDMNGQLCRTSSGPRRGWRGISTRRPPTNPPIRRGPRPRRWRFSPC